MNVRRTAALLPVVAGLAFALTACGATPLGGTGVAAGSSDAAAATGGGACGAEKGMCITVEITGAATVAGSFTSFMPGSDLTASCASWLAGDDGELLLPGSLSEEIGGRDIGFVNRIGKYTGPGTYEGRSKIGSVDGAMHVDVDRKQYGTTESARSTVAATIAADGSGTVTFTDLAELTDSGDTGKKATISGRYSWTCQG